MDLILLAAWLLAASSLGLPFFQLYRTRGQAPGLPSGRSPSPRR